MFINLETDPCIPSLLSLSHLCESSSSNSVRTSAHVRAWTLLGLPLTSVLGHSSGSHSRPHSDITRTPVHVRARTLLGPLLTSALGHYSEPRSSSVIHPPPCNPVFTYTDLTQSSVSIRATSSRNSTRTFRSGIRSGIRVSIHLTSPSLQVRALLRPPSSSMLFLYLQVRAHTFGPRSDLRPRTPFGPPSSDPVRPLSSDPFRTSVLVRVTIRTLVIQLCSEVRSDIRVSLCLTSSSPCLRGPLGPPSLSALRVPRGSKPLVTRRACQNEGIPVTIKIIINMVNLISIKTTSVA
jgi:hypothetical protein